MKKLRIGYVAPVDPDDPDALSSLVYVTKRQLLRYFEVVDLLRPALQTSLEAQRSGGHGLKRLIPARLRGAVKTVRRSWRRQARQTPLEHRQSVLQRAEQWSRALRDQIGSARLDALFTCPVTSPLYRLETDLPIIHHSDAVARPLFSTYPVFTFQSEGVKDAWHVLETDALPRLTAGVWPAQFLADAAIRDYGMPPERVFVLPLGANVLPEPGQRVEPRQPPRRDRLNLCVVASDPVRKRLELAICAAELLREAGWAAELTYIGRRYAPAARLPFVHWAGHMKLSRATDRSVYRRVLAEAHFMLLPSLGENFGVAPVEAAHFGVPSLVSAACGVAEFLERYAAGVVLPTAATASDYAARMARILSDEEEYHRLARAALQTAREVFVWDRFGEGLRQIVETAVLTRNERSATVAATAAAAREDTSPCCS